jgi:hypothetical protein
VRVDGRSSGPLVRSSAAFSRQRLYCACTGASAGARRPSTPSASSRTSTSCSFDRRARGLRGPGRRHRRCTRRRGAPRRAVVRGLARTSGRSASAERDLIACPDRARGLLGRARPSPGRAADRAARSLVRRGRSADPERLYPRFSRRWVLTRSHGTRVGGRRGHRARAAVLGGRGPSNRSPKYRSRCWSSEVPGMSLQLARARSPRPRCTGSPTSGRGGRVARRGPARAGRLISSA